MATNPNAIFGEALATGPRQIPLSELQNQIAQTRQTQAQTANIGSEMAQRQQQTLGLQQQNTLRQRQLEDEQAVRDSIKNNTRSFPVTAPNVSMPTPGTDENGNPLPMSADQHAQAASNAVQGTHTNWDGVYADLLSQGRVEAAETLRKTRQAYDTQDLENTKTRLANAEAQNKRRAEILAGVVSAPPEQQDLLAAQAGIQLQQEGLGGGVGFTANQAKAGYQLAKGAGDPIRQALDSYGLSEAQAANLAAEAEKTKEETKQYKFANDAAEQFLKNPNAVLGPGGMIDSIPGLSPEDARTIKGAAMAAYQMPGTFQEKASAVKAAIMDGVKSVIDERRQKRLATDPDILNAKAREGALAERQKAALAGGPLAGVPTEGLQRQAWQAQNKAEDEWHKAEGDAQRLLDSVQLARSQGNQIAAGMLPLEVLREVVPRVARQEIPMASGGQSVARRLENWISKGATGVPPDVTLQDMQNFGNAMLESAKTVYRGKVGGINRTTRATFDTEPPVTARPAEPTAQPTAGGPVRVTTKAQRDALPNGTQYIDSKGNIATKGQ